MDKETTQVVAEATTDSKPAKAKAPKAATAAAAAPKAPKAKAAPKAESAPAPAAAEAKSPSRNRLKAKYFTTLQKELMAELGLKNINQVPRLEKITLNMRLGDVKDNSKSLNLAVSELATIAGQKPVLAKAKKSVANFKVREGMTVGAKVTLRGEIMYEFFDKLVSIALPRVRDFRGISAKSFDGRGNYAMGIKEQLIFPEIVYDQIEKIRGFDICIVTTAPNDEQAKALLTKLGMPFKAN